jgi:AcrR family transcriptional regulator
MPHPVPIPGTSRARLIEVAISRFETQGFDKANVVEMAGAAGVTTGSLYHHFESKLGLYRVIREEMERRMTERIEGAAAATGGGRTGAAAGLLVAFDAAVRFGVTRILSEPPPVATVDPVAEVLQRAVPGIPAAGPCLSAAWRGALAEVAAGADPAAVRVALEWVVGLSSDTVSG